MFQISALLGVCVLVAVQICSAGQCTQGPQATYQFVGQCTDCSGTGIGMLTVQNYTLGTALSNCNFVSFTYTSNLTSFTITQSNFVNLSGTGLPASLPAAAQVQVNGGGRNNFFSNADGTWIVGALDRGTGGTWSPYTSAVPTLSAAALGALGLLLAGAGVLLMRFRRTARA